MMKARIFAFWVCLLLALGVGTGFIGISYPVVVDNMALMSPVKVERITGNQIELADGRVISLGDTCHDPDWQGRIAYSKNRVDVEAGQGSEVWIYVDHKQLICGTPWAKLIRIPIIPNRIPRNRRLLIAVGDITQKPEQASPSEGDKPMN